MSGVFLSHPYPFLSFFQSLPSFPLSFSRLKVAPQMLGDLVERCQLHSGGEIHLQPSDTFPELKIHKKCICCRTPAANTFFVYKPRDVYDGYKVVQFLLNESKN